LKPSPIDTWRSVGQADLLATSYPHFYSCAQPFYSSETGTEFPRRNHFIPIFGQTMRRVWQNTLNDSTVSVSLLVLL
jgi:hypothetical protein